MEEFYLLPRKQARFTTYLNMLLDESGKDVELPIAGYNPMGKERALAKVQELIELQAEEIMGHWLDEFNRSTEASIDPAITVAINLIDDVDGSWSNRYTTDFSYTFQLDDMLKRNFCLATLWTSETFTTDLVLQRTQEAVYRILYRLKNGNPRTLAEHVDQEVLVQKKTTYNMATMLNPEELQTLAKLAEKHAHSEDYGLLFAFFYGDEACKPLQYKTYGVPVQGGFRYAAHLANRSTSK